jgi:hypothetical protein
MSTDKNDYTQYPEGGKLPSAGTGNASNPPEKDERFEPANNNQLIDERGEKYLREIASIEDYPDAQDQQDMDDTLNAANEKQ